MSKFKPGDKVVSAILGAREQILTVKQIDSDGFFQVQEDYCTYSDDDYKLANPKERTIEEVEVGDNVFTNGLFLNKFTYFDGNTEVVDVSGSLFAIVFDERVYWFLKTDKRWKIKQPETEKEEDNFVTITAKLPLNKPIIIDQEPGTGRIGYFPYTPPQPTKSPITEIDYETIGQEVIDNINKIAWLQKGEKEGWLKEGRIVV